MSDGNKIVLVIKDLGHVPSFKNTKMISRGKLITDPKKQKWMKRCIQNFVYQLFSLSQTNGSAMLTAPLLRSVTHWCKRFDDSVQCVPEMSIRVEFVPKGREGAIVILEQL